MTIILQYKADTPQQSFRLLNLPALIIIFQRIFQRLQIRRQATRPASKVSWALPLVYIDSPIQTFDFLARNIRSSIPRLRLREERSIPGFLHPLDPTVFLLLRRLNANDVFLPCALKQVSDKVRLILRARRSVCECRGRLWTVEEEHVRELGNSQSSCSSNSIFPVACDGVAFSAADVELGERAGDRIEAGC